jgi:hypothetical protein
MSTSEYSLDRALQRQAQALDSVKHIVIGLERASRARERDSGIDLAAAMVRSLVCRLKTFGRIDVTVEEMCERLYGRRGTEFNHVQSALDNLPALIARAAVDPAATTVATWAAEVTSSGNYAGLLPSVAPSSVYAALSAHALRVTVAPNASIKLPARSATPTLAGDFILEGSPTPARRLAMTVGASIAPKKLAVLSHFSLELAEKSVPTIEAVIRQAIADDTSQLLDAKMLDNVAGSVSRPAGLLNGVTPIAAASGGGIAALAADLGAIAAAISAPSDLVYIMNPADQIRAVTLAPGLITVPIITAAGLAAKQVVCVDAADFVSAEGDAPRYDASDGGTLHEEDTTPLAIATTGSPNVVAAPTRSLWQTDAVAIRLIQFVCWAMRRAGRVSTVASVTW